MLKSFLIRSTILLMRGCSNANRDYRTEVVPNRGYGTEVVPNRGYGTEVVPNRGFWTER